MRDVLENKLNLCKDSLLQLVEDSCWNKVSQNCLFIVSDFNEFDSPNHKDYLKIRKKVNNKKNPQNLQSAIKELDKEYDDLYDITLYVFKAKRKSTIIEIQYYKKSNFDQEYFVTVKNNPPMFHAKISLPIYVRDQVIKFDVNWESRNVRHHLNLLIYRWEFRKILKQLKNKNRP